MGVASKAIDRNGQKRRVGGVFTAKTFGCKTPGHEVNQKKLGRIGGEKEQTNSL